eukprot:4806041-Pleurochrysis_carterae.AAC.1
MAKWCVRARARECEGEGVRMCVRACVRMRAHVRTRTYARTRCTDEIRCAYIHDRALHVCNARKYRLR